MRGNVLGPWKKEYMHQWVEGNERRKFRQYAFILSVVGWIPTTTMLGFSSHEAEQAGEATEHPLAQYKGAL